MPMNRTTWQAKLTELDNALARYPHVGDALEPPATDDELAEANAELAPFHLPEWLCDLYRWHNGTDVSWRLDYSISALFERPFLPLEKALGYHREFTACGEPFWFREFTFPFCGMDKDYLLITLDSESGPADPAVLYWMLQDTPNRIYASPEDYIDALLWQLSFIDEDSFDDIGNFDGYQYALPAKRAAGKAIPESPPMRLDRQPTNLHGGTSAAIWTEGWVERSGLADHLIDESDLPPRAARRLPKGPLPHAGPWDANLGYLTMDVPGDFHIDAATGCPIVGGCSLPDAVLPERALRFGRQLDVVFWADPTTLDNEHPTIERIACPRTS